MSNKAQMSPIRPVMGWMQRLFMDSHQRRLADPSQYKAPLDRQALLAEIDAGKTGIRDHETLPSMRRAVQDINAGGPLTMQRVADSYESMRREVLKGPDPAYGDFPQIALAGDAALLEYLVRRANDMAKSIQPGAAKELGAAFRTRG